MQACILADGSLHETDDPTRIRQAHEGGSPLWVDLGKPSHETERFLTDAFEVHPLIVRRRPDLLGKGAAWLAHAFIDALVDRYEPHMNALKERIDTLEEHVLSGRGMADGHDLLPELFALRRTIQALCRTTEHQKQLLETLSRRDIPQIPGECRLYFRDIYDHLTRIDERAFDYKDSVTSLVDAYLTVQSNRMNDTVKRLTLLSTVVLPLNFIASFYGMNFTHMPEFGWRWGRELALAEMGLLAFLVLSWFKVKRWV